MVNDNGTLEPDDDSPIGDEGNYNIIGELQGVTVSMWIEIG